MFTHPPRGKPHEGSASRRHSDLAAEPLAELKLAEMPVTTRPV